MFLEEVFYVTTPGIMLEDNMGCIFLIRNKQMGSRTKAIQIRMHWIREAFEKEELTVDYVKSEENESDIMTKNVTEPFQEKFSKRLRNGTLRIYEQWNPNIHKLLVFRSLIGKPVMSDRICYECKEHGHLAKDCPRRKEQSNNLRIYEQWNSIVQSVDGLHRDTIGEAVEQSNSNINESDESSGTNIRKCGNDLDRQMYYYVES